MNVLCVGEACPVILSSKCVFYEGDSLVYTGIAKNDSVEVALQKIDAAIGSVTVGSAVWGSIGAGTGVASQADLVAYLSTNYYPLASNPAGYLTNAAASTLFTPLTRQLTINGVTQDLNANRTWTISAGVWGSITGTITDQTDLITYLTTNYYPVSNPSGYITGAQVPANETDPVFSAWLAIPPNISIFTNDVGYITSTALTGYVPYTGATNSVNLGNFGLSTDRVVFSQTPVLTGGVGILRWNDTDGTLDLGLKGGNVTLQIGQEQVVRIVNDTGINLTEAGYQVVQVTGAQGNRLKVGLASATSTPTSRDTLGMVTENINNNQEGFITVQGLVRDINTTGSLQGETWSDGDILYVSSTPGMVTNIEPASPLHSVRVGYVVRAHVTQGQIFVKIDNGYELEELHDVSVTPYINNGVLYRDTGTNLWKSATIATILGYTPQTNQLAGLSVLGRSANTSGTMAAITAAADFNILRRNGTSIDFGPIDLSQSGAVGTSILPIANGGTGSSTKVWWSTSGTTTITTPTLNGVATFSGSHVQSSGTTSFSQITLSPTINTTGTYSGIAYGLLYNPTLTSVTGLTHYAAVFTSGTVGIGTLTPSTTSLLQVGGSTGADIDGLFQTRSSTNALSVSISHRGHVNFGLASSMYIGRTNSSASPALSGTTFGFRNNTSWTNFGYLFQINELNASSGTHVMFQYEHQATNGFYPTNGTATGKFFGITPILNTTGTYVGVFYGIDYNPIITSTTGLTHYAAVFRVGLVGIGTSTPVSTLETARSFGAAIETITGNDTLDESNHTVLADATSGNITITLPAASAANRRIYVIKKIDSSVNTVSFSTVDGGTITLSTQYSGRQIQSNGSTWNVIASF